MSAHTIAQTQWVSSFRTGGKGWFINSQTQPLHASEEDVPRRQGSNSIPATPASRMWQIDFRPFVGTALTFENNYVAQRNDFRKTSSKTGVEEVERENAVHTIPGECTVGGEG